LAEKRSLVRFLVIYILSTLFLVFIGEFFYYKLAYKNIIDSEINKLDTEIKLFLSKNKGMLKRALNSAHINMPHDIKIAIYKDKKLLYSNIPYTKVDFDKRYWIEDNKIFYRYEMIKRWGKVDVFAQKPLDEEKIFALKRNLFIFTLFILIFITVIAYFLGHVFLAPLKNVIKNLEDFIRDSTHEMNTPLSVILTNLEMLKTKPSEKNIKRIENAALRLKKIFDDLKFLRLHHKRKREIKTFNLKDFVKERLKTFETQIENKNLKITTECEDFEITIDKEDLIRLIDNILSNAVKYAPVNSEIKITLKDSQFCVQNEGNIKNLKNITKKFVRENESEGGFGLGLFIVSEICKIYGFKLKIENIDSKVNTCLYFV